MSYMASQKKLRTQGRRSRFAIAGLITLGLVVTGAIYTGTTMATAAATSATEPAQEANAEEGRKLFQANCATCHGMNLQGTPNGPSLIGVGELSVEFQIMTGRMPLQAQGPQAPQKPVQFTQQQALNLAAYVQETAPGATYPEDKILDGEGNISRGAELFRINCAMCHNVAAAGGALTKGKWAPGLTQTSALHIYAAMVTGPQNMPVFNNLTLTPEDKRDIISSLLYIQEAPAPGGMTLGSLGPVSEGLFIWIFGIGALVALAVWITAKSN